MLAGGKHFHQSVFAVFLIHCESSPYQNRSGGHTESDANPLVDTYHIHDDEQDEYRKKSGSEQKQILCFQPQAKHPAPCRISTVGFQELASEPDLQVSLYPALH